VSRLRRRHRSRERDARLLDGHREGILPDGLTLEYHENDSFAKINGTPTKAGEFIFVIGAACYGTSVSGQTGQVHYTIIMK
jgi:hypothetical protein